MHPVAKMIALASHGVLKIGFPALRIAASFIVFASGNGGWGVPLAASDAHLTPGPHTILWTMGGAAGIPVRRARLGALSERCMLPSQAYPV